MSDDERGGVHPGGDPSGTVGDRTLLDIERQLGLLGQQAERLRSAMAAQWGLDLDKAAYRALAWLVDHGPGRAASIAIWFGLDESTVSRQIDVLVSAGLVERQRDPEDGRAYLLYPTVRGRWHLSAARNRRLEFLSRALAGWQAHEREAFARALARFTADLQATSPAPPEGGPAEAVGAPGPGGSGRA